MIIYGWKATHIKSQTAPNLTCTNCNEKGKTFFSVFSKHVHIFWIPLFPYGKTGASQCDHCQLTMEKKQMPPEYRQEYERLRSEASTPVWKYAGLIIIAAIALYLYIDSGQRSDQNKDYIANPVKNDVYRMKTDGGNFTTMKVDSVSTDSVYVLLNEYEVTKRSGIYKVDKEENYYFVALPMHKSKLQELFNNGEIYDVDRY